MPTATQDDVVTKAAASARHMDFSRFLRMCQSKLKGVALSESNPLKVYVPAFIHT